MNNAIHLHKREANHLNEMAAVMAARKTDVAELIAMRLSLDAERAAQSGRHCDRKTKLPDLWRRLLELSHDSDPNVRSWVIESVRDGSPAKYRRLIVGRLMVLAEDTDGRVRRSARHALESYRNQAQMSFFERVSETGTAK
jgi:hypothetical protein